MAIVRITGWEYGARTISAIHAVCSTSGFGLAESKNLIVTVMAGGTAVIPISDKTAAEEFASTMWEYGFVVVVG